MSFFKRKKSSKTEKRRYPRVKEKASILWRLKGSREKSPGCLHDISASGLRFATKEPIPLHSIVKINRQANAGYAGALSLPLPWSKVVWVKKDDLNEGYQAGAKFINVSSVDRKRLMEAIKARIRVVSDWETIKANIVYILLWVTIILGSTLFFQQYKSLSQAHDYLAFALTASQQEITRMRAALTEERNKRLTQEELFAEIIAEREALLVDLEEARDSLSHTGALVSQLSIDKESLSAQMASLEQAMLALKGQIGSLKDAKATLERKLNDLRALRLAIRDVKRGAFLARVEAQKRLDSIKLAEGNRGYIIKDREPTTNMQGVLIKVSPLEPGIE